MKSHNLAANRLIRINEFKKKKRKKQKVIAINFDNVSNFDKGGFTGKGKETHFSELES